jgi:predicted peptidase
MRSPLPHDTHRSPARSSRYRGRTLLVTVLSGLLAVSGAVTTSSAATSADREPAHQVLGVTPVTEVGSYGQQVTKVVVEYATRVDSRRLSPAMFRVEDSGYNFRFDPASELGDLVDREIADVYTTDDPERLLDRERPGRRGRYVVLELADDPEGGWTVITSLCPTFLCSVRVNPDQLTQVTQLADVVGPRGTVVSAAAPQTPHRITEESIDREVDHFRSGSLETESGELLYDYRLPDRYDPRKRYPLVVALPGHGMGYDGQNRGVQLASDMLALAWTQKEWTRTRQDVIVVAPQNRRVGKAVEGAQVVELVEDFTARLAVDRRRVYATSVSYGSQLMWEAFSTRPDLFAGGLLTGGFPGDADEFAPIAAAEVPMWITHGTGDHLLPVANARASYDKLVAAYEARGLSERRINQLARWTEYGDEAFTLPDRHLAAAPTLEDPTTLRWLLAQRK